MPYRKALLKLQCGLISGLILHTGKCTYHRIPAPLLRRLPFDSSLGQIPGRDSA